MQHRSFVAPLAALAAAVLAACGGGGGSGTGTPAPVPTTTPGLPCVSSAASTPLVAHRRASSASGGVVPGELYVTYRAGRSVESVARTAGAVHTTSLGGENGVEHAVVTLPAGSDPTAAASALRATTGVTTVAPLHYRTVLSCGATANDQYFTPSDQWYLFRTSTASTSGSADGWSLSHGRGISVAVIDTGADLTNQDLASKITFQESVVTPTGGTQVTSTAAGAAQDTNGHGTNVAGLVGANTNNSYGFASIGWEVGLQIYRVFPPATASSDAQSANTGDEAKAIRDAVANGASIVNLSLGSPSYNNQGFDQAEHDAVEFAIANGVIVVAAGGNEYPDVTGSVPDYPGAYPGVIAVGASAVQDATPNTYSAITSENAASYSNSGVTLLAPGGDPTSPATSDNDLLHWIEGYSTTTAALAADKCTGSGGVCRALFAGTSQATPQVSAALALAEALKGAARSITPAAAASLLQQNADQLPGVPASRQGAGRLDVYKLLLNTH